MGYSFIRQINSPNAIPSMTDQLDETNAEEVAKFIAESREKFGPDMSEYVAAISVIWIIGVMEKLTQLGLVGGGEFKKVEGIEMWAIIDKLRTLILPPPFIDTAIKAFVEATVEPHIRPCVSEMIAMYYSRLGRESLTRLGLELLYAP